MLFNEINLYPVIFLWYQKSTHNNKVSGKSNVNSHWLSHGYEVTSIIFQPFFRMGTFIDSTHMKLLSPSKLSFPAAIYLLYYSNNFWLALWKSSIVSVSMTFVTASFISSIVS